jgi:hypothetical protein
MATYTGTWVFYNKFKEYMADGTIDMDDATADTFKVLLTTSSYTPSATTHTQISDITNELSATGAYARQSLTGVTWTEAAGVVTWNATDSEWTASGADMDAARYWVLYDDTTSAPADALIAYGLIDDTPADVTVTDGTKLTLQWHASGLFTLT